MFSTSCEIVEESAICVLEVGSDVRELNAYCIFSAKEVSGSSTDCSSDIIMEKKIYSIFLVSIF